MSFPKNAHKFSPVIKTSCRPRLLELIQGKPRTVKELCALVERTEKVVLLALRDMPGKVYIGGWRRVGSTDAAIWHAGDAPHVPRPSGGARSAYERARKELTKQNDEAYVNRVSHFATPPVRISWGGIPV